MKITGFYIGTIFSLFCAALCSGGCSDEYEYSTDYSAYDGVTLQIDLVDQNNVLNLNLINGTYTIKVNVTPESIIIDPKGFIYEIENESLATVDTEGTLTMLQDGETKLTVKFRGNQQISTSCTVKISPILTEVLNVPERIVVEEAKSIRLVDQITTVPSQASKRFSYEVENPSIATVDDEGVVTGVTAGNTTITVTTTDGTQISKTVSVEVVGKIYLSAINLPLERIDGKSFIAGQILNVGQYTELEPANASEPSIRFSVKVGGEQVISTTDDGVVTCLGVGSGTLVVEALDGSNLQTEVTLNVVASGWYERSFWFVDTSYRFDSPQDDLGVINYIPDNGKGLPEQLIDGKKDTYITYLKPNRGSYNGYEQHNTQHFLIIDMGGETDFNCFKWIHRNTSNKNWQVWQISLFGSHDGETYQVIQENIDLDRDTLEKDYDVPASRYRYIKIQLNEWDTASGYNMTIAEFNVCMK